jgi:hypothetical protein
VIVTPPENGDGEPCRDSTWASDWFMSTSMTSHAASAHVMATGQLADCPRRARRGATPPWTPQVRRAALRARARYLGTELDPPRRSRAGRPCSCRRASASCGSPREVSAEREVDEGAWVSVVPQSGSASPCRPPLRSPLGRNLGRSACRRARRAEDPSTLTCRGPSAASPTCWRRRWRCAQLALEVLDVPRDAAVHELVAVARGRARTTT